MWIDSSKIKTDEMGNLKCHTMTKLVLGMFFEENVFYR
jgi:hypothetical protein